MVDRRRLRRDRTSCQDTWLPMLTERLVEEVAADLDTQWGSGDISPSSYETAWVAMVPDPQRPGRLAFPEALECLLRTQQSDGSWQAHFPHSILPTMAAALALAKSPRQTHHVRSGRDRALAYLHRALAGWTITSYDTPLFEFLLPLLAGELHALGFTLRVPEYELLQQRQREKLRRLPLELLYSGESNLIHGLEVLQPVLDYTRLRGVQSPQGSYGNSPSATAAVLLYGPCWDEKAATWLRHLARRAFGGLAGAMPSSHPADAFEVGWVLYFLLLGGKQPEGTSNATHRALLRWLGECLSDRGAGLARLGGLPCDVDDTAVALTVLNRSGFAVPLDSLRHFESGDHYVSYAGERTASTSANAHVLEALLSQERHSSPDDRDRFLSHRRSAAKLAEYLLGQREENGSWQDKWHLSPYYATLSSVAGLCRLRDTAVAHRLEPTVSWLLDTQHAGGGWGSLGRATAEETAYALLALRALHQALPFYQTERAAMAAAQGRRQLFCWLRAGKPSRATLQPGRQPGPLPALWVDKSVYAPARVVRAATLAASLAEEGTT